MRVYREGEKSSAVCDVDKRKVTTVMKRMDFQPEGFDKPVPDLLVAVCESCGTVLTIPAQSCARLNAMGRSSRPKTKPIDARISVELEEALNLLVSEVGGPADVMQPGILRYYLGLVADSPEIAARVKDRATSSPVASAGPRRLAIRVANDQLAGASRAALAVGIKKKGDLLRGVATLAIEDRGITYLDRAGKLVSYKPDTAGRQRFADMRKVARFF